MALGILVVHLKTCTHVCTNIGCLLKWCPIYWYVQVNLVSLFSLSHQSSTSQSYARDQVVSQSVGPMLTDNLRPRQSPLLQTHKLWGLYLHLLFLSWSNGDQRRHIWDDISGPVRPYPYISWHIHNKKVSASQLEQRLCKFDAINFARVE